MCRVRPALRRRGCRLCRRPAGPSRGWKRLFSLRLRRWYSRRLPGRGPVRRLCRGHRRLRREQPRRSLRCGRIIWRPRQRRRWWGRRRLAPRRRRRWMGFRRCGRRPRWVASGCDRSSLRRSKGCGLWAVGCPLSPSHATGRRRRACGQPCRAVWKMRRGRSLRVGKRRRQVCRIWDCCPRCVRRTGPVHVPGRRLRRGWPWLRRRKVLRRRLLPGR